MLLISIFTNSVDGLKQYILVFGSKYYGTGFKILRTLV
jgi:hypothetical protein